MDKLEKIKFEFDRIKDLGFIKSTRQNNKDGGIGNTFEDYLQTRLNQFRGINKEKLFSYLKESQIRYNSSPSIIYQKIILNLKSN